MRGPVLFHDTPQILAHITYACAAQTHVSGRGVVAPPLTLCPSTDVLVLPFCTYFLHSILLHFSLQSIISFGNRLVFFENIGEREIGSKVRWLEQGLSSVLFRQLSLLIRFSTRLEEIFLIISVSQSPPHLKSKRLCSDMCKMLLSA